MLILQMRCWVKARDVNLCSSTNLEIEQRLMTEAVKTEKKMAWRDNIAIDVGIGIC